MHAPSVRRMATPPSISVTGGQVGVEGVDYERVDPTTLRVIHVLFPAPTCGFAFFVALLANAVVKQYTFPSMPREVRGDAAVVSITNGYAGLSQRLRLSYDTTHMYLLVYRALGLLYVEKQGKETTIIIPLDTYQPPARLAEILRQLKEHYRARRPRVRRLINNVVVRMESLMQAEQEPEASEQLPRESELLTRVQRVLSAQDIADPDGYVAMSIVTEITPLVAAHAEEVTASQVGQEVEAYLPRFYRAGGSDGPALLQESTATREGYQGEDERVTENLPGTLPDEKSGESSASRAMALGVAEGRFFASNLPSPRSGGECEPARTSEATAPSTKQGRFEVKNLPSDQRTGEREGAACAEHGRFSASILPTSQRAGEPFQSASRLADANLPKRVDSAKILPFNGIGDGGEKKEKTITLVSLPNPDPVLSRASCDEAPSQPGDPLPQADSPVRQQARALARLIEGKEENIGAYVVLLRQHSPQTLRAAVIATLLRKHFPHGKGALKKPGGYFTRRVQQFQHAIPEQVMTLVQMYAGASYEEIDTALATQAKRQTSREQAPTSISGHAYHPKRGEPMDEATAEALARRIPLEDPYVQVRGTRRVQEGMYAVKVFIHPVEYHLHSVEDWEAYRAQMQDLEQEGDAR